MVPTVPLMSLWLPILVSAVLVFIASSVIHMMIGYHRADYRRVPAEDDTAEALRKAAGEYSRVPEKKALLLHALAQHQSADAVPTAVPFLDDMDDEVQIAAAQAMAVQKDERAREPLIQHFLRAHEGKNARVREAVAGLLVDTQFDVKGYTPKVEAALPPAYKLDSKGRVTRKS